MKAIAKIAVIALLLLNSACAHFVPVKIPCPSHPKMEPVQVIDHSITGKDVDNVIENHQRLWKHIHVIEKLGCTA